MDRPHLVILTGAGISAASGIPTFRAKDGLWENHRIEDVASPAGWTMNPELVLRFYNERRRQIRAARPNPAHLACARLEEAYDVTVITQNIDDLHERAGSRRVVHLHGEILKAQSSLDPGYVVPVEGDELNLGMRCPKGSQLRPHVVWFGEAVPKIRDAQAIIERASFLLIVGTSLQVYPAAGLVRHLPPGRPRILIDPAAEQMTAFPMGGDLAVIPRKAADALPALADEWIRTRQIQVPPEFNASSSSRGLREDS